MADMMFWWWRSKDDETCSARQDLVIARTALKARQTDLEIRMGEHNKRVTEALSGLLPRRDDDVS